MTAIYLGAETTRLIREAVKERGLIDAACDLRVDANKLRNAITGKGISFATYSACCVLLEGVDRAG
jgi:hypothetical protein